MGSGGNKMKSLDLQTRLLAGHLRRAFQGHPAASEIAANMPDDDLVAMAKRWEGLKLQWAREDQAAGKATQTPAKKYSPTFSAAGLVESR
jgi:hypothetical protein